MSAASSNVVCVVRIPPQILQSPPGILLCSNSNVHTLSQYRVCSRVDGAPKPICVCVCDMQCANFVRAHKIWRHVTYPGGVVPQSEIVTQMQRLSVNQTGHQGDGVQRQ